MLSPTKGFTLFELLITILLIAVLSGLAIPSLAGTLARQRQSVEINALFHAVHQARKVIRHRFRLNRAFDTRNNFV